MTRYEAICIRTAQLQGKPVTKGEFEQAMAILSKPATSRVLQTNPWGLTAGQLQAIAALHACGSASEAARSLGLSPKTVSMQINRAMERMGVRKILFAALLYERWIGTEQQRKAA